MLENRQHTIVLGDDGSMYADRAWLWMNNQTWDGWRLDLLTCETPPAGPPVPVALSQPHLWKPPAPRRAFSEPGFSAVRFLRAHSDPRVALTGYGDIDAVVIGTRGRGRLRRLHLGSTATFVAERPTRPVVVVKEPATVHRVLVCADGSSHSHTALDALVAMPWIKDIDHVDVLGVAETGSSSDDAIYAATEEAEKVFRNLGIHATVSIHEGNASDVVAQQIERRQPDLLVLGGRGHHGKKDLLLGSTARAALGQPTTTVLLASGA